jgi:hypothetical protein
MMTDTYIVFNGAAPTAAAVTPVTTGAAIKTLLQIKPATNSPLLIVEWGISFDGSAAATPGKIELIETGTVFATVTPFAAGDVMPFNNPNAPVNTAGASGIPLNLSTTGSGFTATAEGTVTAGRLIDGQLIAPTSQYVKQFPLGREGGILPGRSLRIRTTFAAAVNALCYIIFEV